MLVMMEDRLSPTLLIGVCCYRTRTMLVVNLAQMDKVVISKVK